MSRETYLNDPCVESFISWMSQHLDDGTFTHRYTLRRPAGAQRAFASLFDAYRQYEWPFRAVNGFDFEAGCTFQANAAALTTLQHELNTALTPEIVDQRVCDVCKAVMVWGGVQNGNVKWLNDNVGGLGNVLTETADALNDGDTAHLGRQNGIFASTPA